MHNWVAEFDDAKAYVAIFSGDDKAKMTTTKRRSEHCETLKAMFILHLAPKLVVNLTLSICIEETETSCVQRSGEQSFCQFVRNLWSRHCL